MTNPESSGKPTLESLLRLKRAERPDPEFWRQFEQDLRRRQLAATIEPRPWWLGLATLARKAGPIGLPVGAAAALTLAAISYQTLGWSPETTPLAEPALAATSPISQQPQVTLAAMPSANDTADSATAILAETSDSALLADSTLVSSAVADTVEPAAIPAEPAPTVIPSRGPVALAALLPGVGLHRPDSVTVLAEPTPSQRFIAYNLAVAQKENPELNPAPDFQLPAVQAEPAAALAAHTVDDLHPAEVSPRNARLLALVKAAEGGEEAVVSANIAKEQASRLNDDILYASAARLGVGGDRLSIRF